LLNKTLPLALLFVGSCGGVQAPPESRAAGRETVPAAAEPTNTEGESKVAAGSPTDLEVKVEEAPAWSPVTSEGSIERSRSRLQRRCDAGSQAACKAMPDLERCVQLKSAACGRLGDLFARGATGVDRHPENARDLWWKACDLAPADCLRYGKLLFDMDDLDAREAVADRFFEMGCTSDFQLCTGVGRFYQQKNEPAAALKYFEKGCAGGQKASCAAKK
jgi:TPR repeat protein